jgi:hypothetical protein
MVCARLHYFLEKSVLLPPFQSGSRFGRSTLNPLLRLVSDAHGGFVKHQSTLAALIDFSRAYDKVDRYWKSSISSTSPRYTADGLRPSLWIGATRSASATPLLALSDSRWASPKVQYRAPCYFSSTLVVFPSAWPQ